MKKRFRVLAAALALCMSLLCCPAALAATDTSTFQTVPYSQATAQPSGQSAPKQSTVGSGIADAVTKAQTPMTDYGTRLAQRSKPDMDSGSDAAAVTR